MAQVKLFADRQRMKLPLVFIAALAAGCGGAPFELADEEQASKGAPARPDSGQWCSFEYLDAGPGIQDCPNEAGLDGQGHVYVCTFDETFVYPAESPLIPDAGFTYCIPNEL